MPYFIYDLRIFLKIYYFILKATKIEKYQSSNCKLVNKDSNIMEIGSVLT